LPCGRQEEKKKKGGGGFMGKAKAKAQEARPRPMIKAQPPNRLRCVFCTICINSVGVV
jgi:hypothetical protein